MIGTLSDRYPAHPTVPPGLKNMLFSENPGALTARADHSDKNSLPTTSVEWSFGRRSDNASTGAFGGVQVSYTNKLIQ